MTERLKNSYTSRKAFTLLEVVVCLGLISIVLLSFTRLFINSFAATVQAGQTTQATALAQEKMEALLSYSYADLLDLGAELNGGFFSCPSEVSSVPAAIEGFDNFFCYYTIAYDTLELDGCPVDGLRLEVIILQGEEKQVVKFLSFVREKY